MGDDRSKLPAPRVSTPTGPRASTNDDRDILVRKVPPRGVGLTMPPANAIPLPVWDGDITSQFEPGPELDKAREQRPDKAALRLLEKKCDTLLAAILAREAADLADREARRELWKKIAAIAGTIATAFATGIAAGHHC